jgi:phosphocarrier protein FPr/phosphocarrier protein
MTRLQAPLRGWLVPIEAVPDPVFAERMLGDGIAIDPLDGEVRSPADAVVAAVAPTRHSVTLQLVDGAEILIHVGLETVSLGGAGFEALVSAGDTVRAGDLLLRVDLEAVAASGRNLLTPIVVASGDAKLADIAAFGAIAAGAPLARLAPANSHAKPVDTGPDTCRVDVEIPMAHGVHARPAGRIAAALKPFAADVRLVAGARSGNARSPVALLALGLKHGDRVTVEGNGADCRAAVEAVAALIESGMGEAGPAPAEAPAVRGVGKGSLLAGVKGAPGLAVGPAVHFAASDADVPEAGTGAAAEAAALTVALETLRGQLAAPTSGTAADLAAAHLAILDDPELQAAALQRIAAGAGAAFAWRSASRAQAAAIAATGNALLAERAADLRDLERRLIAILTGTGAPTLPTLSPGSILLADDLLPSEFQAMARTGGLAGIATAGGGPTSHVVVLAASAGIPMIVAVGAGLSDVADGATLVLDADAATLETAPDAGALEAANARVATARAGQAAALAAAQEPALTRDGHRIELFANLGSLDDALAAPALGAEGAGLVRTEFLFLDRETAPTEAEQRDAYAAMARAMQGRPLIFRTLDIGGDKPVPYLPMPAEPNPALGARGIRLADARPELLETQLRALLLGVPAAQLRIMLPMVVEVAELRAVRNLLGRLTAELGIADHVPLGVMVETPSAALLAESLAAEADFLSVGTNDLTQYALAADRGNPAVAARIDPFHPAVLRLIAMAAAGAQAHGRWLGVCGGMASDPQAAELLIGLGVTELSAAPAAVPAMKARVRQVDMAQAQALATRALAAASAAEVRAMVEETR